MTDAARMADRPRQLPLPFEHEPQFADVDFLVAPSNAEALAFLARTADWPHGRLALWGEAGTGKTHLLRIWAARTGATRLDGPTLPPEPDAPEHPVAVDAADAAAERPLLHLLNSAAEAGQPVLLAGRTAPARWPVGLPDLASRLRAVTAVEIRAPDDALLRVLLLRLLAERQIAVPEAVQDWLRERLPRTPAAIRDVAVRLDRASLAAGKRVNRAMAAAALDGLLAEAGDAEREDFVAAAASCKVSPCLL
jgi:chromosomal replication initiation ATPase DnaA